MTSSAQTKIDPGERSMPPRERQKAETRSRIVEAAERLFHERGYAQVTLDEVGERAGGYSKGAVYASFATKADLLLAVLEHDFSAVSDAVATALRAAGDPGEIVAALGSWYRVHLQGGGTWARSLPDLVASARYDDAVRVRLGVHLRYVEDMVADLLTEQEHRLEFRFEVPTPTIASIAIATFHGLAVRSLVSGEDTSSLFTDAVGALLRTIPGTLTEDLESPR